MPSAASSGQDLKELASEKPDITPLLRIPTNRYRTPRTVSKCFATDPHQYSAATALFGRFREMAASSSARQHSNAGRRWSELLPQRSRAPECVRATPEERIL